MTKNKLVGAVIGIVVVAIAGALALGQAPKTQSAKNPPPIESGSTGTIKQFLLSEVAQHKDAQSCWSAINGGTYDLTTWISQHPGGPENILSICGKDGSDAFNNQHGGSQRQADILKTLKIGTLK